MPFNLPGERKEMRSSNSPQKPRRFGRAIVLAAALGQILAMKTGVAQNKPAIPLSVPDDWTHRHLIFSGARSAADAKRLQHEPRYWHQWLLHRRTESGPNAAAARILNNPDVVSSLAASVQS